MYAESLLGALHILIFSSWGIMVNARHGAHHVGAPRAADCDAPRCHEYALEFHAHRIAA